VLSHKLYFVVGLSFQVKDAHTVEYDVAVFEDTSETTAIFSAKPNYKMQRKHDRRGSTSGIPIKPGGA